MGGHEPMRATAFTLKMFAGAHSAPNTRPHGVNTNFFVYAIVRKLDRRMATDTYTWVDKHLKGTVRDSAGHPGGYRRLAPRTPLHPTLTVT